YLTTCRPPTCPLFPYTTLFRSDPVAKTLPKPIGGRHVGFQSAAECAVSPSRYHRPIPAHARVEAIARQSRVSRTGWRDLCQRGGGRRHRLSVSRDLPRQGFAGFFF